MPRKDDSPEERARWDRELGYLIAVVRIGNKVFGNARATSPALTKPIYKALEDGLHPETMNEDGLTAVEILGKMVGRAINPPASAVIRKLIDHGYPVMDPKILITLDGELLADTTEHLSWAFNKAPRLMEDGSNHLHYLAEHREAHFHAFLEKDSKERTHALVSKAAARSARASDGRTPLHLLWANPDDGDQRVHDARLESTYLLCKEKGADLMQPDASGVRAIDLIAIAMNGREPFHFSDPERQQFYLALAPRFLDTHTAPVARRRSGVRL